MKVFVKKLRPNAEIPARKHSDDYCYDVKAAAVEWKNDAYVYYTGLAFEIERPVNYKGNLCLEIRCRSSISDTGLVMSNGVGTIDEGYRGEVTGIFYHINRNLQPYVTGDRFAQICLSNGDEIEFVEVDKFYSQGTRGTEGNGSTGRK